MSGIGSTRFIIVSYSAATVTVSRGAFRLGAVVRPPLLKRPGYPHDLPYYCDYENEMLSYHDDGISSLGPKQPLSKFA